MRGFSSPAPGRMAAGARWMTVLPGRLRAPGAYGLAQAVLAAVDLAGAALEAEEEEVLPPGASAGAESGEAVDSEGDLGAEEDSEDSVEVLRATRERKALHGATRLPPQRARRR